MGKRAGLLSTIVWVAVSASAQNTTQNTAEDTAENTSLQEDLRVADSDNAAELRVSQADRQFLQLAIDSGAKEVQLSQRALDRATREDVRQFAQQMVDDHGATNRELMSLNEALLGAKGPPFKKASSKVKREIDQLNALSGAAFDQRYMEIMIKDHQAALDLYGQQAERGKNPQLKALAQKALPELEAHLKQAQKIGSKK